MEYTNFTVECVGPAEEAQKLIASQTPVDVEWTADARLVGDREKVERTFNGNGTHTVQVITTAQALSTTLLIPEGA
jgi:hypothetical protein